MSGRRAELGAPSFPISRAADYRLVDLAGTAGSRLLAGAAGPEPGQTVVVAGTPTTHYAKSGDLHITHQVVGDGPFDLAYAPGIAVDIGARIGGLAQPGEVLVSTTVRDLVIGSGITFEDRGIHVLTGIPDAWQV